MGHPSSKACIGSLDRQRLECLNQAKNLIGLEDAQSFLSDLEFTRFANYALRSNSILENKNPLIQPRGGFAKHEDQKLLIEALVSAGADFVPMTIDSHTRLNDYKTAELLLERSILENANLLNGFPLTVHGHEVARAVYEDVETPISLRHGTPDARLLVETALAAGVTEIEGGGLTYTVPYARQFPIDKAILNWQYVDRLCALLSYDNRVIHRESFGVLTATMVPPCMVVAIEICEMLLAAEQGVTSFALSFGQFGNIEQDCSVALALRELAHHYLELYQFDVEVFLTFHQWMGSFPIDERHASALISTSSVIAKLVGADKIVSKTPYEAKGIPTIEANKAGVEITKFSLKTCTTGIIDAPAMVAKEKDRVTRGAMDIIDSIVALDQTSFWISVVEAFTQGIIDVPYSPHEANMGKLRTVRNKDGGVYITEPGNVPLSKEVVESEFALAAQRKTSRSNSLFSEIVKDIDYMQ